jgi:hypothetical protein
MSTNGMGGPLDVGPRTDSELQANFKLKDLVIILLEWCARTLPL